MNEQASTSKQARPRTHKRIDDLLQQRQKMLVLLWELSKLDAKEIDSTLKETLEDFLGVLVDYMASGHFGLYRRISEGKERRSSVVETASTIYPKISESTDVAIDFTDRYEVADDERLAANLAQDLSTLGEQVTTRIELEDQLIISMLGPDYNIPSPSLA